MAAPQRSSAAVLLCICQRWFSTRHPHPANRRRVPGTSRQNHVSGLLSDRSDIRKSATLRLGHSANDTSAGSSERAMRPPASNHSLPHLALPMRS